MSSFDIFRSLIKLFKEDELDYETFCDSVDEFSSDATYKHGLVRGLGKYIENLDFYNFQDVKLMNDKQRNLLARQASDYMHEYLLEHGLSEEWNDSLDGGIDADED